jgi:acyl carrier protein
VLTGRAPVPPVEGWGAWLAAHGPEDATSRRIREIQDLEARGAEVLYLAADVARRETMGAVVARARERFGPIQGAIHSAGVAGGGIIQLKEPEVAARVMAPKLQGTLVLDAVLRDEPLDFLLLCSSTAALLGGFGQIDYCGANAFLDAFAQRSRPDGSRPVVSVNWDAWKEAGMAVNTPVSGVLQVLRDFSLKVGIGSAEGVDALGRILASGLPQVAVFTMDLRPALFRGQLRRTTTPPAMETEEEARAEAAAPQPVAGTDLERVVIESWEQALGRGQIGVNDNFFELGGDSLTALQVVSRLKARLGREIPIVVFYEAPTVGLLARALADGQSEKSVALDDVGQRAGTRLDMMQRRRQKRGAQPALDPTR